jgi:hypothetical protein
MLPERTNVAYSEADQAIIGFYVMLTCWDAPDTDISGIPPLKKVRSHSQAFFHPIVIVGNVRYGSRGSL